MVFHLTADAFCFIITVAMPWLENYLLFDLDLDLDRDNPCGLLVKVEVKELGECT